MSTVRIENYDGEKAYLEGETLGLNAIRFKGKTYLIPEFPDPSDRVELTGRKCNIKLNLVYRVLSTDKFGGGTALEIRDTAILQGLARKYDRELKKADP